MFTSCKSTFIFFSKNQNTHIQVNGQQYYNACITDYCITSTYHPKQLDMAMCNSYTALARDCTDNYIDVNWRTSSRCRMYFNFLIN